MVICDVTVEFLLNSLSLNLTQKHSGQLYKVTIFREESASVLNSFHVGPPSWSNMNLVMLGFVEWGKTIEPRQKPPIARQQSTTKSTCINNTRLESNHSPCNICLICFESFKKFYLFSLLQKSKLLLHYLVYLVCRCTEA